MHVSDRGEHGGTDGRTDGRTGGRMPTWKATAFSPILGAKTFTNRKKEPSILSTAVSYKLKTMENYFDNL